MADKSISADTSAPSASRVKYDLGRPNWESPLVPDLANPGHSVRVGQRQIIDVLIFGDGFSSRVDFESQLVKWLDDFFAADVYERFRGAFRIRALFQNSEEPVTAARESFYRIPEADVGRLSTDGDWWLGGDSVNEDFRTKLFQDMARFNFNDALYPTELDVSDGGTVIHNKLADLHSHCVVCMLTFNSEGKNSSGFTKAVPRPGEPGWVNVAFGAYTLHEFGHAFAYLEDEYIDRRGSEASRHNPSKRSIFTLSNLSFSARLDQALWQHLSPWGRVPRQGAGADRSPTVGWLWRGGEHDERVWHSEYHCLMNGTHENFLFTSNAAEDPTAQPDGTFAGVSLRSTHRYCLWCQEIVVARILEKIGQLAEPGDPTSINERGQVWHDRWLSKWRDRYWDFFDLDTEVREREQLYATQSNPEFAALNRESLELWRSDLYQPFHGDMVFGGTPAAVEDGEALLLMTA